MTFREHLLGALSIGSIIIGGLAIVTICDFKEKSYPLMWLVCCTAAIVLEVFGAAYLCRKETKL